jgi:hypothetical protein
MSSFRHRAGPPRLVKFVGYVLALAVVLAPSACGRQTSTDTVEPATDVTGSVPQTSPSPTGGTASPSDEPTDPTLPPEPEPSSLPPEPEPDPTLPFEPSIQ